MRKLLAILVKNKKFVYHPYHDEVKQKIQQYSNNFEYDNEEYNAMPTKTEISDIINLKKNNNAIYWKMFYIE